MQVPKSALLRYGRSGNTYSPGTSEADAVDIFWEIFGHDSYFQTSVGELGGNG